MKAVHCWHVFTKFQLWLKLTCHIYSSNYWGLLGTAELYNKNLMWEICVCDLKSLTSSSQWYLCKLTVTHLPQRGCQDLKASSKGLRLFCTVENLHSKWCTRCKILITSRPANIQCKQHRHKLQTHMREQLQPQNAERELENILRSKD